MTVKLGAIVLDSDNIEELFDFYAKMLGWMKSSQIHDGEKCKELFGKRCCGISFT